MIAIPDFVSGAMEHWGLITYRETALLYDPREASDSNKQRVATVIAHEVAHQVGSDGPSTAQRQAEHSMEHNRTWLHLGRSSTSCECYTALCIQF